MTYKELMQQSLSDLLENGETLRYPIYGTLLQGGQHWFGFFGLTEKCLLIVLLEGSSQIISWTSRVPLNIKEVNIKKSLVLSQYKIHIDFTEGNPCNIRVSKKVYGIECQEENLKGFMEEIQKEGKRR